MFWRIAKRCDFISWMIYQMSKSKNPSIKGLKAVMVLLQAGVYHVAVSIHCHFFSRPNVLKGTNFLTLRTFDHCYAKILVTSLCPKLAINKNPSLSEFTSHSTTEALDHAVKIKVSVGKCPLNNYQRITTYVVED